MQKISTYLYPNRVLVNFDLDSHITEWKIVYQRRLKIYKGIDNVIEFDFKNSYQRRIEVPSNVKCVITDQLGQEVCTVDVEKTLMFGIARAVIYSAEIDNIDPQFLKYALYIDVHDSTFERTVVYADTQFGAMGQIELLDGVFPKQQQKIIISGFNYSGFNLNVANPDKHYYSDAVYIKPSNRQLLQIDIDFILKDLTGIIEVQRTNADVVSSSTKWITMDSFNVDSATNRISKHYDLLVSIEDQISYIRVSYVISNNSTGKIDKAILIV